jgi:hypothetical protein
MSFSEKEAKIVSELLDIFTKINLMDKSEKESIKIAVLAFVSKVYPEQDEKKETWVV